MRDALIEGASFTGASADGTTLWPDGFDPFTAGVVVR